MLQQIIIGGNDMSLFISELLSSIVQIILFAVIPFICWIITAKKRLNFFQWIGLKTSEAGNSKKLYIWIICTIVGFWMVGEFSLYLLKDAQTATSNFAGKGIQAIPSIIIYAVFHTALSEEILFRGFLLKRIAARFGFQIGNTVQALLFGLLHGAMFLSEVGFIKAGLLVLFTASIAWTMGYLNEKKAGGSIYPGWFIHGVTNILSGLVAAF